MEIIKQPEHKRTVLYTREFDDAKNPNSGRGFSFDCDENGEVFRFNENAFQCFLECIEGKHCVIDKGLKKHDTFYRSPAIGKCDCGREIELYDPLDNFCGCGECYNSSGQRVTPSSDCDDQGNPYESEF